MIKTVTYSILLLLIFNSNIGVSQVSSFSKSIETDITDLLDSAAYYTISNPALAFDFIEKALELSIKIGDRNSEGDCYTSIGNINYNFQQYDLAIDNYTKAIAIFVQTRNKKKEYNVKELRALAYEAVNELEKSEQFYNESVKDAESSSNVDKLKKSKRGLANIYQKKGEDERAIQELEEVRNLDISGGKIKEQLETNQLLIEAYSNSQPSRALALSRENEEIATEAKDTLALLNTLGKRAEVYGNQGNSQEALVTLKQSLGYRVMQNDLSGQSEDNLKISEVLLDQELIDDAIAYLEESIKLSNKTGELETKKKALKTLSSAYDKAGDYNRALSVYKEYIQASEKSALIRENKILENLELMQSLTGRLQRIDMLENQKILNDKTINILQRETEIAKNSLKQQRIVITSLLIVMLILFLAIYLVYRSSQQKKTANQLLALRSLRSQMNPHFIFNALNSVNNYISKSDERSANKYLSDFSKLMRAVMENSKFDFVSLASEIKIIELYLKLENHRFIEKFNYTFTVDQDIDQENIQIPPMLIQPYIENAVWHGLRYKESKGYLKVEITNNGSLKVIIEDNGIGRKKSMNLKTKNQQESVSTGLKNINNRLQIINQIHKTNLQVAIEDVDPINNTGTRVTINFN